jgi:hypothetical protein
MSTGWVAQWYMNTPGCSATKRIVSRLPGAKAAAPLVEAATPRAAVTEARTRRAPVLLSRHILAQTDVAVVEIEDLAFPRSYVLLTPAIGEPTGEVRELVDRIREHIRIWLR